MTYAVFYDNEFQCIIDEEKLLKYQTDDKYMTYEIDFLSSDIKDYTHYHWLLDINGEVRYFPRVFETKLGNYESSFFTRLKYLFTGKLPCH